MEDEWHEEKIGKKKFSKGEDEKLANLVTTYGPKDWKTLALYMPGRTARQCRERWKYYLNPSPSSKKWTKEEDELLLSKYEEFGTHWAKISKFFPLKNGINLKNRFHKLKRRLTKNPDSNDLSKQNNTTESDSSTSIQPSRSVIEIPLPVSKLMEPLNDQ